MAARIVKIRAPTKVGTIHSRPYVASGKVPINLTASPSSFPPKSCESVLIPCTSPTIPAPTTDPRYVQSYGMYWSNAEKRMSAITIGKMKVNTGTARLMSESTPTSEMMNSTATVTRIIFLYCNFP